MVPLQQSLAYGDAVSELGGSVVRLDLCSGGRRIGVAQALQRRLLFPVTLINRGPIWSDGADDDRRAEALGRLRSETRGVVLVTPTDGGSRDALRASGFREVMTSTTLAILDLDGDLRARMQGKWRNRLAAAERAGVQVQECRKGVTLEWLLRADAKQQRTRGYRGLPADFSRAWMAKRPRDAHLFVASVEGDPVAAMLFLVHGATATYHVGWTGEAGRAVSAHHLILWQACQHLRRKGIRHLDLGVVDTVNTPGLARFKLGTGARPVQTGGTWVGW